VVTAVVVIVNGALLDPAGMNTVAGTEPTAELEELRVIVIPPVGAGPFRFAENNTDAPPCTAEDPP
jgi:hypothetical protein